MHDSLFESKLRRFAITPVLLMKLVNAGVKEKKGCLEYQGARQYNGYGKLGRVINGKKISPPAHRYTWFLVTGKWPKDKLLHHCDNPPCCEFTHLKDGSSKENSTDMVSKGRSATNMKCGKTKYSNAIVKQIRDAKGSLVVIARKFGMSKTNVWLIRTNKTRRFNA